MKKYIRRLDGRQGKSLKKYMRVVNEGKCKKVS